MMKTKKGSKTYSRRVYRRIPRSLGTQDILANCEAYQDLKIDISTSQVYFLHNTLNRISFADLLNTFSQTFIDNKGLYQRYKIIGLSATAYRLYSEDQIGGLMTTYSMGAIWMMHYALPTLTDLGTSPIFSDGSFTIPPFSNHESKSWSFTGQKQVTGSQGLGTWNSCGNAANQVGQISMHDGLNNALATRLLYTIRFTFKIIFSGLNR